MPQMLANEPFPTSPGEVRNGVEVRTKTPHHHPLIGVGGGGEDGLPRSEGVGSAIALNRAFDLCRLLDLKRALASYAAAYRPTRRCGHD